MYLLSSVLLGPLGSQNLKVVELCAMGAPSHLRVDRKQREVNVEGVGVCVCGG